MCLSVFLFIIENMKWGIIDVGGGMRDIFGTGVLDACLEKQIQFDYAIGVSAGSANLASFLSCQKGRNKRFYTQYAKRKEYMSLSNWIHKKNYLDLDYIYGTLANSNGEDPMDYETFAKDPTEFEVVCTDASTGKPVYFSKEDMPLDQYDILKASSCMPIVCQPYPIYDALYFNGGISDPIPVERALQKGCDKVVVILTRPKEEKRNPKKDNLTSKILRKTYRNSGNSLSQRAYVYNESLERIQEMEKENKVCILAPDTIGNMKTLTMDENCLEDLYQQGQKQIQKLMEFMQR